MILSHFLLCQVPSKWEERNLECALWCRQATICKIYLCLIVLHEFCIFLALIWHRIRNCRANFKVTTPIYVVIGWWNWKWTIFPELKIGVPSKCSQLVKSKHFAFIFDGNDSRLLIKKNCVILLNTLPYTIKNNEFLIYLYYFFIITTLK